MGTTLTGTTPQDTYDSLIKVTDNGPLSGTLKKLTDGLGNDSSLSLSTTAASFSGTLAVSGNATFDTTTLVVDAANNRVGVGTASPSYGLDTRGIAAVFNAGIDGTTQPTLYLGHPSYTTTYLNKISTSVSATAVGQVMQFSVGNGASTYADVMTLNGLGNVGIGTSSPSGKLHVAGGDIFIGASYALKFSSTSYMTPENNVSGAEISTAGVFVLKTGSTPAERLRVNTSGNVGIGTSAPESKLHIAGTASGSDVTLYIDNVAASTLNNSTRLKFSSDFGSSVSNGGAELNCTIVDAGNGAVDLLVKSWSGGAYTEKARFLAGGGLTFNGDTAAANALDDYEEGTFTPVPVGWTTNPTNLSGKYTKIGALVSIKFTFSGGVKASATSAYFTGLPFAGAEAGGGTVSSTGVDDLGIMLLDNSDRIWLTVNDFTGKVPKGTGSYMLV